MNPLRAVIVGASGYSGEELVRLAARHPHLLITALTSRQFAGKRASHVIPGAPASIRDLQFENIAPSDLAERAELFFLALPHGVAAEFAAPLRAAGRTVIDLSADFRLRDPAGYKEFYGHDHQAPELLAGAVYALPELYRSRIPGSDLLACPGCYPTSILLPLLPAVRAGLIDLTTITITSLSGASGAGKKAEIPLLFCEVNENMRAYSVPKHRHLSEIEQELSLVAGQPVVVTFIPHLIPLHRGMISTITAQLHSPGSVTSASLYDLYQSVYGAEPFVRVLPPGELPEVKNVARSNYCEIAIQVDPRTGRLLLFSALDNLSKGASSQAIQAMNVRFSLPETMGLAL